MRSARFSVNLRRADLLLAQGRYADAEPFFRAALAEDADNPVALGRFSLCLGCLGRNPEGLSALERAIGMTPEVALLHAQKALLLADEQQFTSARNAAEQSLRLDPDLALAHAAQAEIYAGEHRWKLAEAAAREGLARDAGNLLAQNVLSHALLMQGKHCENETDLAARLAEDPENPYTHCNAGRSLLRRGRHREAQAHFETALKRDPSIDEAREGLLDAFRARSPLYRGFLSLSFFVASFSDKGRLCLIIGILLGYHLAYRAFAHVAPVFGLGLAVCYFLFVLWSFVGRGLGTLIILTDRSARRALSPADFREGVFGGGSLAVGVALAAAGILTRHFELALVGGMLAGCSLPLAVMFRNTHSKGRRLYPAIAALAVGATAALAAHLLFPGFMQPLPTGLAPIAVAAAVATTTWLVNFGVWFESR